MSPREDFNEASDAWYALEPGAFPKVPRAGTGGTIAVRSLLRIPVLDSAGYRARSETVDAAILILSQSPTARRFAETAIAHGYRIDVDPPVIGGAGAAHEDEAFGSADHANRRINLRGGDDPLKLALVLAHELAHVSQIIDGGLDIAVSALHPLAAIRQLMMMEGDARAHEYLVAKELAFKTADDPGERLVFPQAIAAAKDTIGVSLAKKLIEKIEMKLPDVNDADVMAGVFKCLYASPSLRQHYEDTILHAIETLERAQPGTLGDAALFTGGVSAEELMKKLDGRTLPYLQSHAEYLGLGQPQMNAISDATKARLDAFAEKRPAGAGSWTEAAPVYAGIATLQKRAAPRGPAL